MATPRLRSKKLSEPTIARLPVYQRIAEGLLRRGEGKIDSKQIGELAGVTATTVRRDLAGLGSFGTRGAGYDTAILIERIADALGHDRLYDVIVVGIGQPRTRPRELLKFPDPRRASRRSLRQRSRGHRSRGGGTRRSTVERSDARRDRGSHLHPGQRRAGRGRSHGRGRYSRDLELRSPSGLGAALARPCTTWTSRSNCRSSCTTSITARDPWVGACCTLSASPALIPCGARNMSVTEEAMWH